MMRELRKVGWIAALAALGACTGGQKHARSVSVVATGVDCRAACMGQIQGNEFVADCTPPLEMDPRRREPWTTVCFFDTKK